MSESPEGSPITSQELAEIDRTYKPFPAFSVWSSSIPDLTPWTDAADALSVERQKARPEDLRRAVEIAMRAAALDTGAIEGLYSVDRGFTVSVALQTTAWQAALSEVGIDVPALFDAQLAAYELALDVATKSQPVTEAWIRELHSGLCGPQKSVKVMTAIGWQEQEFTPGQYKELPNHVRSVLGEIHAYAPVQDTEPEMHRLIDELSSGPFAAAHPVLQASYAHYAFVAIHPFQDGNGRVARALASVYTYRSGSVPLLIFSDQKGDYFRALAAADAGTPARFITFVLDRLVDAANLVADRVATYAAEPLDTLRTLLTAQGGLSHVELDSAALKLLSMVHSEVQKQLGELTAPPGVTVNQQLQGGAGGIADVEGYRRPTSQGDNYLLVYASVQPPAQAGVNYSLRALVARDRERPPFLLEVAQRPDLSVRVRLEDVVPEVSSALRLRIAGWVGRVISSLLQELEAGARKALRDGGYLDS